MLKSAAVAFSTAPPVALNALRHDRRFLTEARKAVMLRADGRRPFPKGGAIRRITKIRSSPPPRRDVQLSLPDPGARYTSGAQRARVATEAWAAVNLYCPRCKSGNLTPARVGTKVKDFACPRCELAVQLKAKRGRFGSSFTNSAYSPKIEAIRARELPDYALLSYDLAAWAVTDLTILPGHFISEQHVLARKPLSPTARRAGWVGSTVQIGELPPDAFVRVVKDGEHWQSSVVRAHYLRFEWLRESPARSAGWTADVLREVRALAPVAGMEFSLSELYREAEARLGRDHSENRHIRDKIRQQLQVLRDRGILVFEGRGSYRVID